MVIVFKKMITFALQIIYTLTLKIYNYVRN